MSKLKPCPFCGGEAGIATESAVVGFVIKCGQCWARTKLMSEENAIMFWNNRFPDSSGWHPLSDTPEVGRKVYVINVETDEQNVYFTTPTLKPHGPVWTHWAYAPQAPDPFEEAYAREMEWDKSDGKILKAAVKRIWDAAIKFKEGQ